MRLGSTTPGETPGAGCVKRPHNSRLKGVSRPFTVSAVTEWMSVVVTQCEDEFQDSGLLWWGHLLTPSLRTTHHSRRNIDGGLWAA